MGRSGGLNDVRIFDDLQTCGVTVVDNRASLLGVRWAPGVNLDAFQFKRIVFIPREDNTVETIPSREPSGHHAFELRAPASLVMAAYNRIAGEFHNLG